MIAFIHVLLIWLTLRTPASQSLSTSSPLSSEKPVDNDIDNAIQQPNKFQTSMVCDNKSSIVVNFTFSEPFSGVIYANQIFSSYASECRSYGNGSEVVHFVTTSKQCGVTHIDDQEYQLVLYVQNDRNIQQASDEKVELSCAPQPTLVTGVVRSRANNQSGQSSTSTSKLSAKSLYEGSVLQVHRMLSHTFSLDHISEAVECRMDVMKGRIPFLKPIDGFVDLGQDVTVMIKIRQIDGIDSMVSRCYAHEGSHLVKQELTNNDGCSIDKNILPNFELMPNPPEDYKVLYTTFPAFKFPDKTNLNIQCTVLICNTTCPQIQCDNRDNSSPARPSSPALGLRVKRRSVSDSGSETAEAVVSAKSTIIRASMPHLTAVTADHNNHSELTATATGVSISRQDSADNESQRGIKTIGSVRKVYISESDAQCLTSKIVLVFALTLIALLCSALIIACYYGHKVQQISQKLLQYKCIDSTHSSTRDCIRGDKTFLV